MLGQNTVVGSEAGTRAVRQLNPGDAVLLVDGRPPRRSASISTNTGRHGGNNKYGNKGTLKCSECRRLKRKCEYDLSNPQERCRHCVTRKQPCSEKVRRGEETQITAPTPANEPDIPESDRTYWSPDADILPKVKENMPPEVTLEEIVMKLLVEIAPYLNTLSQAVPPPQAPEPTAPPIPPPQATTLYDTFQGPGVRVVQNTYYQPHFDTYTVASQFPAHRVYSRSPVPQPASATSTTSFGNPMPRRILTLPPTPSLQITSPADRHYLDESNQVDTMNFNYFLDSQAAGPEFPFASPRMASPFVPGPSETPDPMDWI